METERCNEIDLIQRTLAGDTSAFDQLVKKRRRTIYALVLSYIKNPADAEDLTQRIFIRAYERLSALREPDKFLAWLQQIAHNTCKDWRRRRPELPTSIDAVKDAEFSETAPSAEEIVLKAEVVDIVRKAIDELKETDRRLMQAHYIEGASYDELQHESGLSYAAIANRLKRAKREVRRRVRQLLGGVMILPNRTIIWGGMDTVNLSMKTKLAAAVVTAVIGIGGGGVMYRHASQPAPVAANELKAQERRTAMVDSSTDVSSTTHAGAAGSSATDETSNSRTSRIDNLEIAMDGSTKTYLVRDFDELPEWLIEEIEVLLHNRTAQHPPFLVGDEVSIDINVDGAVVVESETGVIFDGTVEDFPEAIRETLMNPEMDALDGKLGNQALQVLLHVLNKERSPNADTRIVIFEGLPEALKQKIARVTMDEITWSPAISEGAPPLPTDSQPQSTVTAPMVESATIPSGPSKDSTPLSDEEWADFERLLSDSDEFSDEEWTELERLLGATAPKKTLQQDNQAPSDAARGRNERLREEPPAAPPERQELWRGQPDLPERNSDMPPYPMAED